MVVNVQTYCIAADIPDIVSYGGPKEHVLDAYALVPNSPLGIKVAFGFVLIYFNTVLVRISVLSKMA
jgi:hypothetical protein